MATPATALVDGLVAPDAIKFIAASVVTIPGDPLLDTFTGKQHHPISLWKKYEKT
jgi:hypothetical protein